MKIKTYKIVGNRKHAYGTVCIQFGDLYVDLTFHYNRKTSTFEYHNLIARGKKNWMRERPEGAERLEWEKVFYKCQDYSGRIPEKFERHVVKLAIDEKETELAMLALEHA